jgi:hypothetical protein
LTERADGLLVYTADGNPVIVDVATMPGNCIHAYQLMRYP